MLPQVRRRCRLEQWHQVQCQAHLVEQWHPAECPAHPLERCQLADWPAHPLEQWLPPAHQAQCRTQRLRSPEHQAEPLRLPQHRTQRLHWLEFPVEPSRHQRLCRIPRLHWPERPLEPPRQRQCRVQRGQSAEHQMQRQAEWVRLREHRARPVVKVLLKIRSRNRERWDSQRRKLRST